MKKIIALCSVIVVLAIVVTAFTACGDKTEDNTTETTAATTGTGVELGGVVVEIGKDNAVIKEDGFVVQTLKYPENSKVKFDLEYAQEHYEFIDFNFDGVNDFYIATSTEDGVINYYCWLYNETTELYEYSKDLSALKNISVNADKHMVISTIPQSEGNKITCYKWVDGVLTLDKSYDSSKDKIPEDVTNVVENNSIGANKNPSADKNDTTDKAPSDTKETTKTTSSTNDTTKKPSNVTTTQASVQDGVVLNTNSNIDDGWF